MKNVILVLSVVSIAFGLEFKNTAKPILIENGEKMICVNENGKAVFVITNNVTKEVKGKK